MTNHLNVTCYLLFSSILCPCHNHQQHFSMSLAPMQQPTTSANTATIPCFHCTTVTKTNTIANPATAPCPEGCVLLSWDNAKEWLCFTLISPHGNFWMPTLQHCLLWLQHNMWHCSTKQNTPDKGQCLGQSTTLHAANMDQATGTDDNATSIGCCRTSPVS